MSKSELKSWSVPGLDAVELLLDETLPNIPIAFMMLCLRDSLAYTFPE